MLIDPECESACVRFDVPTTGRLDLKAINVNDSEPAPALDLYSCERGSVVPGGISIYGSNQISLDVPPGPYVAVVSSAPATLTVLSEPALVDVNGTCMPNRSPIGVGGEKNTEFGYVRRWGTVESQVSFDLKTVLSSGFFHAGSIARGWVGDSDPSTAAPFDVYSCPIDCVTDLNECTHDSLSFPSPPKHELLGASVQTGQLIHFATGPRYQQDWSYSVGVWLTPF